jgi:hypothetical protein
MSMDRYRSQDPPRKSFDTRRVDPWIYRNYENGYRKYPWPYFASLFDSLNRSLDKYGSHQALPKLSMALSKKSMDIFKIWPPDLKFGHGLLRPAEI